MQNLGTQGTNPGTQGPNLGTQGPNLGAQVPNLGSQELNLRPNFRERPKKSLTNPIFGQFPLCFEILFLGNWFLLRFFYQPLAASSDTIQEG